MVIYFPLLIYGMAIVLVSLIFQDLEVNVVSDFLCACGCCCMLQCDGVRVWIVRYLKVLHCSFSGKPTLYVDYHCESGWGSAPCHPCRYL